MATRGGGRRARGPPRNSALRTPPGPGARAKGDGDQTRPFRSRRSLGAYLQRSVGWPGQSPTSDGGQPVSPPHRCWLGTPARHRAGRRRVRGPAGRRRRARPCGSRIPVSPPVVDVVPGRRPLCSWQVLGRGPPGDPAPAPAATGRGAAPDVLPTAMSGSRADRTRAFTPSAPGDLAGPRQYRKPSFGTSWREPLSRGGSVYRIPCLIQRSAYVK